MARELERNVSDDLQIPAPAPQRGEQRAPVSGGYRPRRERDGFGGRRVVIAAVAAGGVALAGLGAWSLLGRRPAAVPVIEADARPLRVKPVNPGGMQFAGSDEGAVGADRMAPAAEAPAPQALRAQLQPPTPAPAPAPASASAPAVAAPAPPVAAAAPVAGPSAGVAGPVAVPAPSPAVPGASPLPDTPARVQAARPSPAAPPPVPAKGGTTMVQLGAVETEAAAQAEWVRLGKRLPELLGPHRLVVQKAERDGQAVFRLRTGGFADAAEAGAFCQKVRAKGAACTVATF